MKESSHNNHRNLYWILGIAFLIRIATIPLAHIDGFISDEREYIHLAHQLNDGKGFIDSNGEFSIKVPVFPALIAICFRLWPSSLVLPFLCVALSSTLSIYLGYLVALHVWHDRKIALWAAGVMAFFPSLVLYGGLLMTESLFILLLMVLLLLALRLCKDDRVTLHVLFGVASGIAVLTRAAAFGLIPTLLLAIWAGRRTSGIPAQRLFLAFSVWCLVLVPWTVRNFTVHQEIVPVSTFSGRALLTGSNPFAHGTAKLDPGFNEWLDTQLRARGLRPEETRPEGKRVAAEQAIAIDYATTHPGRYLILAAQKAYVFWIYPITYGQDSRLFQASFMVCDILLLIGVVSGAVVGSTRHASFLVLLTPIVYFTVMNMLLYAEARFRLPALPLLCIIAAGSSTLLDAGWRQRILSYSINRGLLIGGVTLIIALYALTALLFLGGRIV